MEVTDPLEALAVQHGAITAAPAPSADPLDALAAQHGAAVPVPATFATVNGQPIDDEPQTLGTLVKHTAAGLNPLTAVQTVLGAALHPINTAKAIGAAQEAPFRKAQAAYQNGDYTTAARHFVDYLLPIVGPALDASADELQAGKWASGSGDALGLALSLFAPQGLSLARQLRAVPRAAAPTATTAAASALTPEELASNAFAAEHGVPLDAATATGSRTARAMEKRVANSLGGEGTATDLITAQQQALGRVGDELAGQVNPGGAAVSPDAAGAGVRRSLEQQIAQLHDAARQQYSALRAIEADPSFAADVETIPTGSLASRRVLEQLTHDGETVRSAPTTAELRALREIQHELQDQPFQRGRWVDEAAGVSSDGHFAPGQANASVYHSIQDAQPGLSDLTGTQMAEGIGQTLETGQWNNASRGAMVVAKRMVDPMSGALYDRPRYPGTPLLGHTERVALPVDLGPVQDALEPLYRRMADKRALVGSLQGHEADAYARLHALLTGPPQVPLSVADAALSDLKRLSRGAALPELRSSGQGAAAHAVRQLDEAVRQAAAHAGPNALEALEQGRAATKAKYQVADVYDAVRTEPVKAYQQLVQPRDQAIGMLRRVAETTPDQIPSIGRAYLQQLLDFASERGRFDHVDRLYADWQKLGPQTKRILFGTETANALDKFFLLAKRIGENPNPSGTAHTLTALNFGSIPVTWALSKLLYTPRGVQALAQWMKAPTAAAAMAGRAVSVTGRTAAQAAWLEVVNAGKAAGVELPRAADQGASPDPPK